MRAIRRFTVRVTLPEPLAALHGLMLNLRWSWHAPTADLFASIDPVAWEASGGDPIAMLSALPSAKITALAADEDFLARLGEVERDLSDYMSDPRWYASVGPDGPGGGSPGPAAIAYFSPEYGITAALPQYSGGLGILAGDHLKSASDLGVPLIAVGLLYRHGYFTQSLSADGWQAERYPSDDPNGLPLELLRDAAGAAVHVTVGLTAGRQLSAQVWVAQVGRVPLLLLDSYVEENEADLHEVTDRLYGGGSDHRLRQELLLGVGGVRAVRAFCALRGYPSPEVFHTNEGHAGFLGLERIREYVEQGLSFDEAIEVCRAGTVFTTHTPVAAGIDRFERSLIARALRRRPAAAHRPGTRARRGDLPGRRPRRVQHGRDGHAPGPAGQRRLGAARPGEPGDVRRPVAGLRHPRGAHRLGHQRCPHPHLGGARDLGSAGRGGDPPRPPRSWGDPSPQTPLGGGYAPPHTPRGLGAGRGRPG